MSDTQLTNLIVNSLTRDELHSTNFTGHENEVFIQKDHAGVYIGGAGVDGLDTTNISNCITEIPQDIKLEINSDGALVLKAGSKFYAPNGPGVFDEVSKSVDLTFTYTIDGVYMVALISSNQWNSLSLNLTNINNCVSGSSDSLSDTNYHAWYDTTNNVIKKYSTSSTVADNLSLPIGIVTISNGVMSIDQVFNGFGYIGSTIFALPGVKGLIPNGRNADGTLNNIAWACNSVKTRTFPNTESVNHNVLAFDGDGFSRIYINEYSYNIKNNINMNAANKWSETVICSNFSYTNGKIESMETNFPFHAVDYNDTDFIAHQAMPSDKYVNLTLPSHGATLTAPADGYIAMAISTGTANLTIGLMNITAGNLSVIIPMAGSGGYSVFCPVSKNDVVRVYHYNTTPDTFRLVTTNGIK